jgi:chemotaxis protein methyltransferase CheR
MITKSEVHHSLSTELLTAVSNLIAAKLGLHYPQERYRDMERNMRSAAKAFGYHSLQDFCQWLLATSLTQQNISELATHFTVGETYFFRHIEYFNILENHILIKLISDRYKKSRKLTIWSAGCSTGEEPYSLAILLHRLIPDILKWNIKIIATDINQQFLQQANEGIYGEWSFRGVPENIKEKYFSITTNNRYQLSDKIKSMVQFAPLNLADEIYQINGNPLVDVDIILCRNVLIYFNPDVVKKVITQIYNTLAPEGWLIMSPSETSLPKQPLFYPVSYPGVTLFSKKVKYQHQEKQMLAEGSNVQITSIAQQLPVVSHFYNEKSPNPVISNPAVLKNQKITHSSVVTPEKDELSIYQKALLMFQEAKYTEVVGCLAASLKENLADSKTGQVLSLLAGSYLKLGRYQEALQWCQQAIDIDKTNYRYHYLQATIILEQGDISAAADALKHVLFLNHQCIMAHFTLGNIFKLHGNTKNAAKYFNNALHLLASLPSDAILPESESDNVTVKQLNDTILLLHNVEKQK